MSLSLDNMSLSLDGHQKRECPKIKENGKGGKGKGKGKGNAGGEKGGKGKWRGRVSVWKKMDC